MRIWLLTELKGAALGGGKGGRGEGRRARIGMLLRLVPCLPEWGRSVDTAAYSFGSTVERYGRAYG